MRSEQLCSRLLRGQLDKEIVPEPAGAQCKEVELVRVGRVGLREEVENAAKPVKILPPLRSVPRQEMDGIEAGEVKKPSLHLVLEISEAPALGHFHQSQSLFHQ
jgi:hypothetical protein